MPPRSKAERDEEKAREETEAAKVQKERSKGAAALDKARADEAAKTDEQKLADEELAKTQQEAAAKEEAHRVDTEQKAAEELRARIQESMTLEAEQQADAGDGGPAGSEGVIEEDLEELVRPALPADCRILKAGTVVDLNGEPAEFPVDVPLVIAGAADEQRFASVLARDPRNFALNADRLRLVYNPMNGTPLPLSGQRLTLEEMTNQERAVFQVNG